MRPPATPPPAIPMPGLVAGVVSIVFGALGFIPMLGIITAAISLIAGLQGLRAARAAGYAPGAACAVAGLVLAWLSLALHAIALLFIGGLSAWFIGQLANPPGMPK